MGKKVILEVIAMYYIIQRYYKLVETHPLKSDRVNSMDVPYLKLVRREKASDLESRG